jgi:hypothetical protein
MRVSISMFATAALALIYSSPVQAQETATQIVGTLQSLTVLSQNLQDAANGVTAINGLLLLYGAGPFPVF